MLISNAVHSVTYLSWLKSILHNHTGSFARPRRPGHYPPGDQTWWTLFCSILYEYIASWGCFNFGNCFKLRALDVHCGWRVVQTISLSAFLLSYPLPSFRHSSPIFRVLVIMYIWTDAIYVLGWGYKYCLITSIFCLSVHISGGTEFLFLF